jgi:hypothetical protein
MTAEWEKTKEESVTYTINKLESGLRPYAKAWLAYMKAPGGKQPALEDYGDISYQKAQAVRVALAPLL